MLVNVSMSDLLLPPQQIVAICGASFGKYALLRGIRSLISGVRHDLLLWSGCGP